MSIFAMPDSSNVPANQHEYRPFPLPILHEALMQQPNQQPKHLSHLNELRYRLFPMPAHLRQAGKSIVHQYQHLVFLHKQDPMRALHLQTHKHLLFSGLLPPHEVLMLFFLNFLGHKFLQYDHGGGHLFQELYLTLRSQLR